MVSSMLLQATVVLGGRGGEHGCGSAAGCVGEALGEYAVPVLVLSVALVVLFSFARLRTAREHVREERRRAAAEREAFAAFAAEVREMPAQTGVRRASVAGQSTAVRSGGESGVRDVKDAYRDTVMAVDHYDEEYGESLEVHMTTELGPDVASGVITNDAVTPPLKEAVASAAENARDQRARLVDLLDEEADQLTTADETFSEILEELERLDERPLSERSFDDLAETWERVRALRGRCRCHLDGRQTRVHAESFDLTRFGGDDVLTLMEYLYGPMAVTYPVLATGAELLETLETAEDRLVRSLVTTA